MSNTYFQFKQFTIHQENCAMKVGTDGVLLGAWTTVSGAESILDIGTGTGLIALMLAQRSDARITAVEIEPSAYRQASENARLSPWYDRIEVVKASFQEFCSQTSHRFDLIVTNPPFFTDSLKAPDAGRLLARHTDTLPSGELMNGVEKLLNPDGQFSLILPYVNSQLFIVDAAMQNLYCNRKTVILPAPHKKPHRFMMQFSRKRSVVAEDELAIRNIKGDYSKEYRELTKDYYLFF